MSSIRFRVLTSSDGATHAASAGRILAEAPARDHDVRAMEHLDERTVGRSEA